MEGMTPEQARQIIQMSQVKARSNLGHRTYMPSTIFSLVGAGCGLYLGILAAPALSPLVLITAFAAVPATVIMVAAETFISHEETQIEQCNSTTSNRYCDMKDLEWIIKQLTAPEEGGYDSAKKPMPPAPEVEADQGAVSQEPLRTEANQAAGPEVPDPQTEDFPFTTGMPKKESGSESTEPSGPVPYVEAVLEWPEGTHVLAIGKSGSAKTSTLIQLVKDQSRVIYLTTKGGEHGDHVPPGWVSALLNDLDEITFLKQIQGVIDLIYKLLKQDAPFTLIIDEALDMKETVHDFMKSLSKGDKENFPSNLSDLYLSALRKVLTKGRSAKHRLALVTQNPNGTAIFGQARLTEGFSKVLCTSERESSPFSNALSWANQLYEGKLTPENRKSLRTLKSGYWHFWLKDNQLHGGHPSPTPDDMVKPKPFDLHRMLQDLKVINPIPEEAMPQSEVFTPSSPVPPAPPDSSPKAGLEDRILSTLILKGIPMSLGELKDATKMAGEKSDDYRARAEPIIQRFLHEGLITEHVINGTVKYRTARSVQGPGNI